MGDISPPSTTIPEKNRRENETNKKKEQESMEKE